MLVLTTGAWAGDIEAEIGLTLNSAAVVVDNPAEKTWLNLTLARIQAKLYLGSAATLEAHYQATLRAGPGAGSGGGAENLQTRLRLADLEPEINSGADHLLVHDLDRLWLNLDLGAFGLGLGRQVIGHGPGRFFNPTDIFSPLPVLTTYSEYKRGVDALRLTRALERGGEIELIGVAHRDGLELGLALLRTALEFQGWGFSAYGGYSLGLPTLGLALSGELGDAGWYLEGFSRLGNSPDLRASAGIDYRFPFDLEIIAEVLYHDSGAGDESGYQEVRAGRSFREGEIFLTGKWYSVLYLGYEITPLIRAELTWLQNYGDGSAIINGGLSWDLNDHVLLRAGALIGLGRQTEVTGDLVSPGTEFGDYGTSLYLELRLTF